MADLRTLDAVSAYNKMANLQASATGEATESTGGESFTEMVQSALGSTYDKLKTAETTAIASANGSSDISTEDLALAVASAEMSLKTVVAIRDKLVSAFQDIIRMSI